MNLKVVIDVMNPKSPRLIIGEPKDFEHNTNLLFVGHVNNTYKDYLESLLNKSYALMMLGSVHESAKPCILRIINSKKINWFYQGEKSWFYPKRIKDKNDLRKKIQIFKRRCQEENDKVPF